MKFSFKYLTLLCLIPNFSIVNAGSIDKYTIDDNYSKIYVPDYRDNSNYCSFFKIQDILINRYPIFNEFTVKELNNNKQLKQDIHKQYRQESVNSRRLSYNISKYCLLFRKLIDSVRLFFEDINNDFYYNSSYCDYNDIYINGFLFDSILEALTDELINFHASQNNKYEKTISDETREQLISFKNKYKGIFENLSFENDINSNSFYTLNTIYNEFNKILTEENNKISHTYDS